MRETERETRRETTRERERGTEKSGKESNKEKKKRQRSEGLSDMRKTHQDLAVVDVADCSTIDTLALVLFQLLLKNMLNAQQDEKKGGRGVRK